MNHEFFSENMMEIQEIQGKKEIFKKKRGNKDMVLMLIPMFLLLIFIVLFFLQRPDSVTQVENAENTTRALKYFRVSLETYYQKYGNYPENLITDPNFLEIYAKKELDSTKGFEGYPESNQVYILENFEDVTENGGWNYNPRTGEIRANLKFDSYHQKIDWSMI